MTTSDEIKNLFAEFPTEAISWRAQSLTRDGTKAMALAYIDARDVMDRLDDVCGPDGWQDRYEFSGPRTICYLSINVDGVWITKADGAGDTAVEAEKGAISDAFKRAAVKWGIGRYLYAIDAPWVPCESANGKWKSWTSDPWRHIKVKTAIRDQPKQEVPKPSSADMKRKLAEIDNDLLDCQTIPAVNTCAKTWASIFKRDNWPKDFIECAAPKFEARRKALQSDTIAAINDEFPGGSTIVNERITDREASQHPLNA